MLREPIEILTVQGVISGRIACVCLGIRERHRIDLDTEQQGGEGVPRLMVSGGKEMLRKSFLCFS
jgi:hypothetical protein